MLMNLSSFFKGDDSQSPPLLFWIALEVKSWNILGDIYAEGFLWEIICLMVTVWTIVLSRSREVLDSTIEKISGKDLIDNSHVRNYLSLKA
jgi:hypothetical protein